MMMQIYEKVMQASEGIGRMAEKLEALENKYESLETKYESLEGRYVHLLTEVASHQAEQDKSIYEIKSKVYKLEENQLTSALRNFTSAQMAWEKLFGNLKTRLADLEAWRKETRDGKDDNRLDRINEYQDRLAKQLKQLADTVEQLNRHVGSIETQLIKDSRDIGFVTGQVTDLKKRLKLIEDDGR